MQLFIIQSNGLFQDQICGVVRSVYQFSLQNKVEINDLGLLEPTGVGVASWTQFPGRSVGCAG